MDMCLVFTPTDLKSFLQVKHYLISCYVELMCAGARCAFAERSLIISNGSQCRLFSEGHPDFDEA
jgi:hypothetical protein